MKYMSSEVEVLKCIRDEKMAIGRDSNYEMEVLGSGATSCCGLRPTQPKTQFWLATAGEPVMSLQKHHDLEYMRFATRLKFKTCTLKTCHSIGEAYLPLLAELTPSTNG